MVREICEVILLGKFGPCHHRTRASEMADWAIAVSAAPPKDTRCRNTIEKASFDLCPVSEAPAHWCSLPDSCDVVLPSSRTFCPRCLIGRREFAGYQRHF